MIEFEIIEIGEIYKGDIDISAVSYFHEVNNDIEFVDYRIENGVSVEKVKKASLLVSLIAIILAITIFSKPTTYITKDSNTVFWINNFIAHEYGYCDSVVEDDSDKIYTFDRLQYFNDDSFYDIMLDTMTKNISSIDIVSYEKVSSDIFEYKIKVKYTSFKKIDSLEFSKDTLNYVKSIKDNYKNGNITLVDVQNEFKELHKTIFLECCFVPDKQKTQEFTLIERDNTFVDGTKEIINTLIDEMNIKNNVKIFQEEVVEKTKEAIRGSHEKQNI